MDINSLVSALQTNQNSASVTTINDCVLMAGFIKESDFIEFTNSRLGKKREHKINRGEALAVLLLCMAGGRYTSLLGTQEQIMQMPVSSYIDLPEGCGPKHFTREVFADALSALFNYDHEKFFREFAGHVIPRMADETFKPEVVSIDTTTVSTYHCITPKAEDADDAVIQIQHSPVRGNIVIPAKAPDGVTLIQRETISVRHGHSKNKRTDLGQVIVGAVVDGNFGIPLAMTTQSGDTSDKVIFQEMAEELLNAVSTVFSSVRYLTGDSALCTKESFDCVLQQGKHLITRVPDRYTQAEELIKLVNIDIGELQPLDGISDDGSQLKAYKTRSELYGHPVDLVLVCNQKLSSSKKETIYRRAKKEKTEIEKQLKVKFKCREDALAHIGKLQKSCKYCTVTLQYDTSGAEPEPLFDKKEGYNRRGRPSADMQADPDAKVTQYIRAVCSADINDELIARAIEQECRYVLVSTDVESGLSAQEIIKMYKCNALIESLWALFKSKRLSVNSFYLKREDRIEGLITMMSIAVLAYKLMESKIRKSTEAGELEIPMPDGKKSKYKPTTRRINEYLSRHSIIVVGNPLTDQALVLGYDQVVINILKVLGSSWLIFITPQQYDGFTSWVTVPDVPDDN